MFWPTASLAAKLSSMTDPTPEFPTHWKRPNDCTVREREIFEEMVIAGGEVDPVGLTGRILDAERLVFCRSGELIVGVAGLKKPSARHRKDVSDDAGVPLPTDELPLEFGWAFVCPGARKRGISGKLLASILEGIECGVFATSRANNEAIHAAMKKAGFSQEGKIHLSRRAHKSPMALFVRPSYSRPELSV